MHVADHVWQRLKAWNVQRVYGYAGNGISGLMGALDRLDGGIEFVQTVRVPRQVRHVVDRAVRVALRQETLRAAIKGLFSFGGRSEA